jgi:superfamily II DNA or RNA helicase
VKDAEYMANRFTAAGIPALAVSGKTGREERALALRRLRDREVNALFTVDLFNEGLDVPDVDTLLLLRPTQSATIFLQQLGRGLRRTAVSRS